jgi:hypothetical protein
VYEHVRTCGDSCERCQGIESLYIWLEAGKAGPEYGARIRILAVLAFDFGASFGFEPLVRFRQRGLGMRAQTSTGLIETGSNEVYRNIR